MTQARTIVLKPFKLKIDRPVKPHIDKPLKILNPNDPPRRLYKKKEGFTRWRDDEHSKFLETLKKHGRNW